MLELQNGITVIDSRMAKIDMFWMIRTRTCCDNKLLCLIAFYTTISLCHLNGMTIDKLSLSVNKMTMVTVIESLAHASLFADHFCGMTEYLAKSTVKSHVIFTIQWVMVELDNTTDRMTQRFRRNGSPVCTATANTGFSFNDGYIQSRFR